MPGWGEGGWGPMPWGGTVDTGGGGGAVSEPVALINLARGQLAQALLLSQQISLIRKKLNDKLLDDEKRIWPDAEIVRWFQDGYRKLLSDTKAVKRLWIEELPARFTFTHTHPFEGSFHSGQGWQVAHGSLAGSFNVTTLWEAEHLEGLTPNASRRGNTQGWELAYLTDETDHHFRFALPRDHDVIKRVAWDDERLYPATVRELDTTEDGWMREAGEPVLWTGGVGRSRSFEVFEIRTDYQQAYILENPNRGVPRHLSGSRTWSPQTLDPQQNGYAYSSQGDAQALTGESYGFAPTSSYSDEGDALNAIGLRPYRFTISGRYFTPERRSQTFTQPWENDLGTSTGKNVGTYEWERVHGYSQWDDPDPRPKLKGPGRKFTLIATDANALNYTQVWEKEQVEGSTVTSTGSIKSTAYWESGHGADKYELYLGTPRLITSPDRDYVPMLMGVAKKRLTGRLLDWRSTVLSLSVLHAVIPEGNISLDDEPDLIPRQMLKYIRYYVLSRAFGRLGEGRRPELAEHYESRFMAGLLFFKKLGDVGFKDRVYARQELRFEPTSPARVRLPAEFPVTWRE